MAEENKTTENQTEEKVDSQTTDESTESVKENEQADKTAGEADSTDNAESPEKTEKEISPEEKIAALEKENAELKDQLLRRAADFDNYRKRMMKEKQDTYDYANADLLGDLLDSLDNFDRTVDAAKDAKDVKSIADGVKMINKNLVKMLEDKYGLVGYAKSGDDFNPEEHEAIGRCEDPKAKKETLKEVYLKGYKLKDKIIRHAKVMVSVPQA